jgi:hypothetical protein
MYGNETGVSGRGPASNIQPEAPECVWQPIATAPERWPVLVYCPRHFPTEAVLIGLRQRGEWANFVLGYAIEPTHWMHLPGPPTRAREDRGRL